MQTSAGRIELWRSRLLDTSRRNRLLYFKPSRQSVRLTSPAAADLFIDLVVHGRKLDFPYPSEETSLSLLDEEPEAASEPRRFVRGQLETSLPPAELSRLLYKLRLKTTAAIAEQGVNTLYLTLGLLEWREVQAASEVCKAPLLMVPVTLERKDDDDRAYRLSLLDEDIVVNPTLAHKLKMDFGLTLPDAAVDEDDFTLRKWFREVESAVRRQGWTVSAEVWLGEFSFQKLAMYRDLELYRNEVEQHPVVGALARVRALPGPTHPAPTPEREEHSRDVTSTTTVLDSDSSQLEAILHARNGEHLVIDGPPGTGKSQTIANVIADLLANGRKVLFVSEKMTALEVVHQRLRQVGLGPFCLEVHSHKANKRAVIGQLGDSLLGMDKLPRWYQANAHFQELVDLRTRLNSYVEALHRPRDASGRSAFEVHGILATTHNAPDLAFDLPMTGLVSLSTAAESAIFQRVARIAAKPELLAGYQAHPWRGSTVSSYSIDLQERLRAQFSSLLSLLEELDGLTTSVMHSLGLEHRRTRSYADWLLGVTHLVVDSPLPPSEWFVRPSLQPLLESASSYKDRFDTWHTVRQQLLRYYTPRLFDLDCAALLKRLSGSTGDTMRHIHSGSLVGSAAAQDARPLLESRLRLADELLTTLPGELRELAGACGLMVPQTLAQADLVCQTGTIIAQDPRPQPHWLHWESTHEVLSRAEEAKRRQTARSDARAAIDAVFKDGIYDLPSAEWLTNFTERYTGLFKSFNGGYKRDRAALQELLKAPASLSHAQAVAYLKQLNEYAGMVSWANEHRADLQYDFGLHFEGEHTDWDTVVVALRAVQQLLRLHGGALPSDNVRVALTQSGPALRAIRARTERAVDHIAQLRAAFDDLGTVLPADRLCPDSPVLDDCDFDELRASLRAILDQLGDVWEAADTVAGTLQPGVRRSPLAGC